MYLHFLHEKLSLWNCLRRLLLGGEGGRRVVTADKKVEWMHSRFKRYGSGPALAPVSSDGPPREEAAGSLSYAVRDLHRAFSRALQARIVTHGVSMGQWFFLRVLWEEDGLTQRELSQRVGMMEPTTVTALNTMESRGLVDRVRNPHDRRKVNIYLTPKGRALRDTLLGCAAEVNDLSVQGVSPTEQGIALSVLTRMIANLGGTSSSAVPEVDEG